MKKEQQAEAKKNEQEACASCKEMHTQLDACMKTRDEYLAGWQRARADYLNFQKAEAERVSRSVQFANESLLQEIVLVIDSFSLARMSFDQQHEGCLKSLELLQMQLEGVLKRYGLEEIPAAVGDAFNPHEHEAVQTVEKQGAPPHTILEIAARGYRLHGKIVRPVRVVVAK